MRHISHGADVEHLDDTAVALRRQGESIAAVGDRGAVLLQRLRALWEGPDFEKFAKGWRLAHRSLDDAEGALRQQSRRLADEAETQRRASGIFTGGSGHGRGAPGDSGLAFERSTPVVPTPLRLHPIAVPPGLVDDGEILDPTSPAPARFEPPARVEPLPAFRRSDLPVEPPARVEPLPADNGAFLRPDVLLDPRDVDRAQLPDDWRDPGRWLPPLP